MIDKARVLTWSSLGAWAASVIVLVATIWLDSQPKRGLSGDVGAGIAGEVFAIGIVVFWIASILGVILGSLAARRAPGQTLPAIAQGLNIVTLAGVTLSGLVLVLV